MTDPKWARPTSNGRFYEDPAQPGKLYVSATNVLDKMVAIHALAPSAADLTARYGMDHLDEALQAAADPEAREAFIGKAKRHYENVWEKRRDLGSKVHAAAEAHVLGGENRHAADPEVKPFLGQYLRFLDEYQVDLRKDVEAVECTALHRGRGYGCTTDLWAHLQPEEPHPAGRWIIDIKTSLTKPASQVYPQMALQLAANRFAEVALDPFDKEFPVPEFVGAAILNLRPWSYGFIPMPADHNAYRAFVSLLPAVAWLDALDLKPHKPINPKWRKPRNWDKKQKEVAA
ncbi:hypothetical protein [Nonomuraea sp. LPB2021202275-12-8]|uniref:hypothetical protein n=1 Tax=Nonomuraea sp. LPB2021202275-12-8 TaxID=3120159 RepID=UPI00300D330F